MVRRRRMVRGFTPEPVPWATVERQVRAAQHAPSAGLRPGVSFVAVADPARRRQVAGIAGQDRYTRAGLCAGRSCASIDVRMRSRERLAGHD
jgi:nitroreductase